MVNRIVDFNGCTHFLVDTVHGEVIDFISPVDNIPVAGPCIWFPFIEIPCGNKERINHPIMRNTEDNVCQRIGTEVGTVDVARCMFDINVENADRLPHTIDARDRVLRANLMGEQ
jgi:hypothetical protein